ncbi:MAG: hypothetical protein LRZ85_09140 [Alphaproteobacteria bacterium]|nr:hypothetical protein [Alphaproteobacteria bacterium]MCD8526029.1 hypothetical protein [Alphaproteobacteria bacterium]
MPLLGKILPFRHAAQSHRSATAEDLADFLIARLEKGGSISHVYSYSFKQANKDHVFRPHKAAILGSFGLSPYINFIVAKVDTHIPPLYGASSIEVIALPGAKVSAGGHNGVLPMDNPLKTSMICPLYTDVAAIMAKKGRPVTRQDVDVDDYNWIEFLVTAGHSVTGNDFKNPEKIYDFCKKTGFPYLDQSGRRLPVDQICIPANFLRGSRIFSEDMRDDRTLTHMNRDIG